MSKNFNYNFFTRSIFVFLQNLLIKHSTFIIAASDSIRNECKKRKLDAHVFYGVLDWETLNDATNSYQSLLKKYNINPNNKLICYTGAIDPTRGAFNLLKASKYLDGGYNLVFCGYGNINNLSKFNILLNEMRLKTNCNIHFLGDVSLSERKVFLSGAQLSIMPQLTANNFSNFSFPSKLLMYLVYSSAILTSKMGTVITSPFKKFLYFYDSDNPETIAIGIINLCKLKINTPPKKNMKDIRMELANLRKKEITFFKKIFQKP